MRIVMFYHSLRSDWNHGNAHFLRGIVSELASRGHDVVVYEPAKSWSAANLVKDHGAAALTSYRSAYPGLEPRLYDASTIDLDAALDGADLVLVHEWNPRTLVKKIGRHKARDGGYVLLFHDTHHRSVTAPDEMAAYDLSGYDGVLVFGDVIRDVYLDNGWAENVWTWHEAADTRVFKPRARTDEEGDLVWIGNWGDGERTAELRHFLLEPVRSLGLAARVYGVRYPATALRSLSAAGIEYSGWLPNFLVPDAFARYKVTVHVPRRPYVQALPGIPTIRVFEALACGIPLVSAPWPDTEGLFAPGRDFLVARDGAEMAKHLRTLLNDPARAKSIAASGLAAIRARHTCSHRVDELLDICGGLSSRAVEQAGAAA